MREESDAIGSLMLPDESYYGVQTERARNNFNVSGRTMDDYPELIQMLAAIKKAAALANRDIGVLDTGLAEAITQSADEISQGKFPGQFPVDVFQGGGGTSLNMNMNEVIANRANEILTGAKGYDRVHPNTHVNMGQSTNDVIPSAMKLCCHGHLCDLEKQLRDFEKRIEEKTIEFSGVVKLGRTCLQDAVPMTIGQQFSGYLGFVRRQIHNIQTLSPECLEIILGGTAVGTGLGVFPGYIDAVYPRLSKEIGLNVKPEANFFDGMQNGDIYLRVSALVKAIATGLSKIATDLRILSSGPRAGFNEFELPAVQPGSSIMPGKINPVIPEMINQICYQVCGNDIAITMAVEGGELDLNVWEPVIIKNLFEAIRLTTNGAVIFGEKCIRGITINACKCREDAEASVALSTVVSMLYGYKAGSKVAMQAYEQKKTVKDVVTEAGYMTKAQALELLDPLILTDAQKSARLIKRFMDTNKKT